MKTLVGTPDPDDNSESGPSLPQETPRFQRLPRERTSKTWSFRVADVHGYVTVGEYEDGRPGEIFLRLSKQGFTLAGVLDAFASSVSIGLQHGIPLETYVGMYVNGRFEPAGVTDDPDIRFASSVLDYVFKRLAMEYMAVSERAALGILAVSERLQPVPQPATDQPEAQEELPEGWGRLETASDAPFCYVCGLVMQRAGVCFVCIGCGTTSGCS